MVDTAQTHYYLRFFMIRHGLKPFRRTGQVAARGFHTAEVAGSTCHAHHTSISAAVVPDACPRPLRELGVGLRV